MKQQKNHGNHLIIKIMVQTFSLLNKLKEAVQ